MQEPLYYLQIEAVNLYPSVYDTSQLSVVRGGSLLLKWAVEIFDKSSPVHRIIPELDAPQDRFELPPATLLSQLEAVSTGASSGIFQTASAEPKELAGAIARFLSGHDYLRHFTFIVVWTAYQDNFAQAKERLLGKARREQLRHVSLAPGSLKSAEPCALEGILPANTPMRLPPKNQDDYYKGKPIAPACQRRFRWGRYFRHGLYRAELQSMADPPQDLIGQLKKRQSERWRKEEEGHEATRSFEEIADGPEFGNLENKIAVFYADGNGFGGIQKDEVKTVEDQRAFDKAVKDYRREFLKELLERWKPAEEGGKIRLETLLWGGDEMLFVVPASQGFALAQLFYAHSQNWKSPQGTRLTHAGGLVFCHHKTPIGRAQKLARELADSVKDLEYGRKGNFFDYAVLESIDYPAEPLADFFRKRYGPLAGHRFPLRPVAVPPETLKDGLAACWDGRQAQLARLLESLPKSQAYLLAQATPLDDWDGEKDSTEQAEQRSLEVVELPEKQPRTVFLDRLRRFKQLQLQRGQNGQEALRLVKEAMPPPPAGEGGGEGDQVFLRLVICQLWNDALRPPDAHPNLAIARWQWLHLVELWDYLAPAAEKESNHE